MEYRKQIYLKPDQKDGLENLIEEINEKGSKIPMTRLISDAIDIFLEFFKEDAVEVYTRNYGDMDKENSEKRGEL
jgi:hypothetical protein